MKKTLMLIVALSLVMSILLTGCNNVKDEETITNTETTETQEESKVSKYVAGEYVGSAESHGGNIEVLVTVDSDKILSIDFNDFNDSEFSIEPRDTMVEKIIEANSTNVDVVTGATKTTTAIKEAVTEALSTAIVDDTEDSTDIVNDEVITYEDITTDIVVIGGGGAGLTAAITASENGADVVLVEKLTFLGGNTNYATGGLNAAGTLEQEALGIVDDVETFYNDTMKGGKELNDPKLVETLTSNAKDIVRWLTDKGADLTNVGVLGGSTNNRSHRPTGGAPVGNHIVSVLSENAKLLGVNTILSTTAMEVLVDDNAVKGVRVMTEDGQEYTINAKAVIIATGGYGANNDLVAEFVPALKGYGTTNAPGATGDVFDIVENLNVDFVNLDKIQTHPTVMPSNNYMITEAVRGTGAILVNREGTRFVNELETRDVVSNAELDQTGQTAYLVFDQNVRDNLSAINGYYEKGFLMEAETLEELANTMEIPAEELVSTVDTYNQYVNSGNDEDFGRAKMASTIEMTPFYAVEVGPAVHHTMGGVKIDSETRVYTTEGTTIDGLYAAGEVTGGVHGGNRLGGNAMADITVFGHIAGKNASEFALEVK